MVVARVLYRSLLRASRLFDKEPLLKATLRRPDASVNFYPLRLRRLADTPFAVLTPPPFPYPFSFEISRQSHSNPLTDLILNDIFGGSDAVFYRPTTQFTSIIQSWFRRPEEMVRKVQTNQILSTKSALPIEIISFQTSPAETLKTTPSPPNVSSTENTPISISPRDLSKEALIDVGFCVLRFFNNQLSHTKSLALKDHASSSAVAKSTKLSFASNADLRASVQPSNSPRVGSCLLTNPLVDSNRQIFLLSQHLSDGKWRGFLLNKPAPLPRFSPMQQLIDAEDQTEAVPKKKRNNSISYEQVLELAISRGGGPIDVPLFLFRTSSSVRSQNGGSSNSLVPETDGINAFALTDSVSWIDGISLFRFAQRRNLVRSSITSKDPLTISESKKIAALLQHFVYILGEFAWPPGHLERELRQGYYYHSTLSADLLLAPLKDAAEAEELWELILRLMGGEYQGISQYPRKTEEETGDDPDRDDNSQS